MIKKEKRKIIFIKVQTVVFIALSAVLAVCCVAAAAVSTTKRDVSAEFTIVIDAGHGGADGGVVGVKTGVKESDLNLVMAETLSSFFKSAGVNVVFTRKNKGSLDDDKKIDFAKRKKIIETVAPDLVLSIHMNFYKRAAYRRGTQVFFNPVNPSSRELAHTVQQNMNANINMPFTGRGYQALAGDYYIVNCTEFPSVIVECGFLSNAADEELLADGEYQKKFCYYLFSACMSFLFTRE